ncbi:MAG TPA: hypothetical protein VH440_13525 [Candidatus Limnocylindrales bacterium]
MHPNAIRIIAPLLLAALAVGCSDTGSEGHGVYGLNESDHDVIVQVPTTAGVGSYLLRARSSGTVSYSFNEQTGDIVVFGVDCRPIATLAWTRADVTVRIAADGTPTLTDVRALPSAIARMDHVDSGPSFSGRPC